MNQLDVFVRFSNGAYNTNRVGKLSGSSTSDAETAARRLAEKVFGPALQTVAPQASTQNGTSSWTATADADKVAWCWATGLVEFGETVPEDAIGFAKGPDRALRQVVEVAARHGKGASDGKLLVPGVPEAKDQNRGLVNLGLWANKLAIENGSPKRFGVVFGFDIDKEA